MCVFVVHFTTFIFCDFITTLAYQMTIIIFYTWMACSKCGCNICILSYNPTNCYTRCPIISVVNITDLHIASLQICCHLWKTGLSLHLSQVVIIVASFPLWITGSYPAIHCSHLSHGIMYAVVCNNVMPGTLLSIIILIMCSFLNTTSDIFK